MPAEVVDAGLVIELDGLGIGESREGGMGVGVVIAWLEVWDAGAQVQCKPASPGARFSRRTSSANRSAPAIHALVEREFQTADQVPRRLRDRPAMPGSVELSD
jgi:hypothetical protein